MSALSRRVRTGIKIGPHAGARNRKKHDLKLFLIILDPALNQEVNLIRKLHCMRSLKTPRSLESSNKILLAVAERFLVHKQSFQNCIFNF